MIQLLDHGYVKLIPDGCWGSDEIIIESARMSTDKGFEGWGPQPCERCRGFKKVYESFPTGSWSVECPKCKGTGEVPGDEKLLKFLWDNKHLTPFEMAGLTIEVQAPIIVFREWHRHRTQSYNEMSGRYIQLPNLYYVPSVDRLMHSKQATTNKQSSEAGFTAEFALHNQCEIELAYEASRKVYEDLLARGIAKEVARLVLPVAQYSRMRASANLRNWLGFLSLRMDPAAQWEIRQYAKAVALLIQERFPRTYQLALGTIIDYKANPVVG